MDPRNRHLPIQPIEQKGRQTPRRAQPAPAPRKAGRPARTGPALGSIEPGSVIGGFEVVRELGRSLTGIVFEARQRSRERLVALKVLSPALEVLPHALARFREEASLAARVVHPGVLPVLAAGSDAGREFYAMALATGPTLAQFIEGAVGTRGEGFFHEAALRFADLARTVEALHRAGVLHRKISPRNLHLAGDRFLLTDFELAIDLARRPLGTGGGEPAESGERPEALLPGDGAIENRVYSAPEEFLSGAELDPRADIYSLGISLYELAAGILPFPSCSGEELARLKLTRRPIAPRRLNPEVPLGIEAVIRQAIEENPTLRHATAGELARDLERFASQKRGLTRRHDAQGGRDEGQNRAEDGGEDAPDLARIA